VGLGAAVIGAGVLYFAYRDAGPPAAKGAVLHLAW
jgi:hypothetical protein